MPSEESTRFRLPTAGSNREIIPGVRNVGRKCEEAYRLIEPQINPEGVHIWPFDPSFPIDVVFQFFSPKRQIRMNRHDFFELLYVCSGSANLLIHDRELPAGEGDLLVIGSTLFHRVSNRGRTSLRTAAVFFHPDLIRAVGGAENAEYLTPFLWQEPGFPHVVRAKTGVPAQAFALMQRIRAELPPDGGRPRLAVKTYLKMILMLLVNHYSTYSGAVERSRRQEQALERLRPVFRYLEERYSEPLQVRDAARICAMSESHFMSFFKGATGQAFVTYLNHCRIERAQALLTSTDKPIVDISHDLGFCDQSYFGAVFRKLVGLTPATYRRRFRLPAR